MLLERSPSWACKNKSRASCKGVVVDRGGKARVCESGGAQAGGEIASYPLKRPAPRDTTNGCDM